jgi:predicted acetyltransferase
MQLVWPSVRYLSGYIDALRRGWSLYNLPSEAAQGELEKIAADPHAFLALQVDKTGAGPPVKLPDGSMVARLPGYRKWLWDGEFCGAIGFRWQPGTSELPPYVLGHIGFSVVPWKRRQGYATKALNMLLAEVREEHLEYVELTTGVSNLASQRVISANGGICVERFFKPPAYGGAESFRYRIYFSPPAG